jgi:hypothetical protein
MIDSNIRKILPERIHESSSIADMQLLQLARNLYHSLCTSKGVLLAMHCCVYIKYKIASGHTATQAPAGMRQPGHTRSGMSAASAAASAGRPARGEEEDGLACLGDRFCFLGAAALRAAAAPSSACDAITTMSPSCSATALHRSVLCLQQPPSIPYY